MHSVADFVPLCGVRGPSGFCKERQVPSCITNKIGSFTPLVFFLQKPCISNLNPPIYLSPRPPLLARVSFRSSKTPTGRFRRHSGNARSSKLLTSCTLESWKCCVYLTNDTCSRVVTNPSRGSEDTDSARTDPENKSREEESLAEPETQPKKRHLPCFLYVFLFSVSF